MRWRDAMVAAAAISAREAHLLRLVSRLPLAPVDVLRHFCGPGSREPLGPANSAYRAAARLRAEGLVASLRPPQRAHARGRPPRLLYPSDLGLAAAVVLGDAPRRTPVRSGLQDLWDTDRADATLMALVGERRLSGTDLLGRVPGAGRLMAEYRLLAALAAEWCCAPVLSHFEPRWRPRYFSQNGRHAAASLPPLAHLTWYDGGHIVAERRYILLPDLDAAPVAAYRRVLAGLYAARAGQARTGDTGTGFPTVVIAARAGDRLDGWTELLREMDDLRGSVLPRRVIAWNAHAGRVPDVPTNPVPFCSHYTLPRDRRSPGNGAGLGPSHLRPLTSDRLDRRVSLTVGNLTAGSLADGAAGGVGPALAEPPPLPRPPRPSQRAAQGWLALGLAAADYRLLDLIGRHPFLSIDELAVLLDVSAERALRRRARLTAQGLVRVLQPGEAAPHLVADDLSELTADGLRLVSAAHGLSLDDAVRHNGLVGGGPHLPAGSRLARLRAELLDRLEHDRGADGFFVRLAHTARRRARADGRTDEALLVWRNPLACRLAPGTPDGRRGWQRLSPLRPDGYGEYRRGGASHGFFLEFDRGTENRDDYLRKFAAYYEYRDSRRYRIHYDGFPQLLLVTTDTHVEQRIARYAREAAAGRVAPLPLLLTAAWRYHGRPGYVPPPDGLLGPIWRTAETEKRRRWLE